MDDELLYEYDEKDTETSSSLEIVAEEENKEDNPVVESLFPTVDKGDLEFDIDGLEDKPWRRPGADITDYFNYGFDEQTWKLYCLKQKQLREEYKRNEERSQPNYMPRKTNEVEERRKYDGERVNNGNRWEADRRWDGDKRNDDKQQYDGYRKNNYRNNEQDRRRDEEGGRNRRYKR
ncbi:Pre-mRNA polyadenylation factor fip1 [Astathelohania contejeani]|uniref:Pre-mRNA polyadenylation factor fip1 n=1 Tax=Astathelohania contejeani TaxID=164912 RepID=A0ABQ7HYM6_9MICR|nr:Pre-mRNA polyadenylation factor fip1 [Thelohania contejeani]